MHIQIALMLWRILAHLAGPSSVDIVVGTLLDLTRGKADLIAENAVLRQQLIILRRSVKKPHFSQGDWLILIVLAWLNTMWHNAILIV